MKKPSRSKHNQTKVQTGFDQIQKKCKGDLAMKNRINGILNITTAQIQPHKAWRMLLALILVLSFGGVSAKFALADSGVTGHTFNVTFTKWISSWPNMVGIVGGDVGTGTFSGEVINYLPGVDISKIEALYHIHGGVHSFTAHVFVTQNNVTGMASITGSVTEGWLEGKPVNGSYKVWTNCPLTPPGNSTMCFQGTLHLSVGE